MKQFKIFSVLAFIGVTLVSCNSSENDPYKPEPSKGDYVKVESMEVILDLEKEHLVKKLYSISYNSILKPKVIKEYSDIDITAIPSIAPLSYEFSYLKEEELNSIVIKKDGELELDKLIANYQGGKLTTLEGKDASKNIKYEFLNANTIKATQLGKTYTYEYNNRGNLSSVSDESGKLFAYEYGVGYNPFVHSEYNLLFDYVPGGDLVRFVLSSKNEVKSAVNEKTGEVFKFTYKLDEFGYPIRMEVEGKSSKVLVKFTNAIMRRPS
ncbi:hypothetical protein [Myroides sp.]|uniref:hypothetical protein n=1 Tax=Myroides sp. TaxID=1874736 RepID=UPI003F400EAB